MMKLLVEHVNPALVQGVQKCLSRRRWLSLAFERTQEYRLRAAEGLASNAGRPFLKHEFRRALDAGNHQTLADLLRFNRYRLSQIGHRFNPPLTERGVVNLVPDQEPRP